jgi:hypothetical protein
MLEDEFLPTYDVSDAVAVVVDADAITTWAALMEVDLIALGRHRPLVGVLGALRLLPELIGHLLHGEPPPAAPKRMGLRDIAAMRASGGGWILLGERPDQQLALGLVGKFWRPVIEYAEVAPEDFRDFSEPGWAKTVYALSARPLEDRQGTLLSGVMRTATTDEHARRWFRRYWTFGVGSGAHVLVTGLLDAAREDAEHKGIA